MTTRTTSLLHRLTKKHPRRVALVASLLILSISTGCDPKQNPPGATDTSASTDTSETGQQEKESVYQQWVGDWNGTAVRNSSGLFLPELQATNSFDEAATDDQAKIEFRLSISERFLMIPGVENCKLAMTFSQPGKEPETEQSNFQMSLDENDVEIVNLRGAKGNFSIKRLETGEMLIQGKPRTLNSMVGSHRITAHLRRVESKNGKDSTPVK